MFEFFFLDIPLALAQTEEVGSTVSETQSTTTGGVSDFMVSILFRIPYWIAAFILVILAYFLARYVAKYVIAAITKARGEDVPKGRLILVRRAISLSIFMVGFALALQIANIVDVSWLLGAMGIGIGFSLKDLINNFVSGIIILVNAELHIGDIVKVDDIKGTIVDIQARATIIQAFDGTKVTIPNGTMLSDCVICYNANPYRRIEIEVGVSFNSDLDKAKELGIQEIAKSEKIEKDRAPYAIISELQDSAILIKFRFWIKSRGVSWLKLKSQMINDIKKAYDANGIEIPFPIVTVEGTREKPLAWETVKSTAK